MLRALLLLSLAGVAQAATPDQTGERTLGDAKAPVTIVEYASLTCPACAHFERTGLAQLKADYIDKGKVRLIFRDYPLDSVAVKAAATARCAPVAQYFPLKEHLFRTQESWAFAKDPVAGLKQQSRLAGLSDAAVDACLADKQLEDSILTSRLDGERSFKIQAIPTFILNDGAARQSDADYAKLKAEIDRLLAR
jgi:protein-disulfide isomerase